MEKKIDEREVVWDGPNNCMICEKLIPTREMPHFTNAAIIGEDIKIKGHATCIKNIERLIMVPNRQRMISK